MKLLPICLLPALLCALFAASPIHSTVLVAPHLSNGVSPPVLAAQRPLVVAPVETEEIVEVPQKGGHHQGGHKHHHGEHESVHLCQSMEKLKLKLKGMMHEYGLDCIRIPKELKESMAAVLQNIPVSARRIMLKMRASLQNGSLVPDLLGGLLGGLQGSVSIRMQEIVARAFRAVAKFLSTIGLPSMHAFLVKASASIKLPASIRSAIDGFNSIYELLVTLGYVTPAIGY